MHYHFGSVILRRQCLISARGRRFTGNPCSINTFHQQPNRTTTKHECYPICGQIDYESRQLGTGRSTGLGYRQFVAFGASVSGLRCAVQTMVSVSNRHVAVHYRKPANQRKHYGLIYDCQCFEQTAKTTNLLATDRCIRAVRDLNLSGSVVRVVGLMRFLKELFIRLATIGRQSQQNSNETVIITVVLMRILKEYDLADCT